MRLAHDVETVRSAERALMARLPEGALMQRAAAGLATACADLLGKVYGSRVTLLVGSGDNGGDALYAGARLARRGAGVTALLLSPDRAHAGGLAALRAAGGTVLDAQDRNATERVGRADLVVDGIVGIGGKGGLRPRAAELADAARGTVVAVDLPSGVDADTGEVRGAAVRADATVTFGTYKPGLLIDPAREYAGALRLVDIGLELAPAETGLEALQYADVAALLPRPTGESDKYRRGVVGIVAGSARYPGAAVLAVAGALHGGAGAVRYVGPAADAVLARFPEALVSAGPPAKAGRVQSWVIGPGLGDDPSGLHDVLASDVPVLIDADGLRLADPATVRDRAAPTVLTPHAGEAAALLGVTREQVETERLASVRELAARYDATVLLKGSTTLISPPDETRPARVNPTGSPWLATAGSGDVLSGLTGSLLAAGLAPLDAASVGAHLHGLAARHAADGAPISAQDVAGALRSAWQDVTENLFA
ncbi:NAD(P)H-hydrate dehydratase [Streptomyces endophyticus]|uniref:Bifunctional NAD(P)H-hydrate repair enzyme n=1 Tax=Streptomyces endophyticus TaxID=714166 RepID=A0ABU6FDI3_9ACTN|nr:NAD(P)H-hydrate dehydratase [Streptomyces endophyticus]MEB8341548.1 NAD(P)H-hydrate dehydratase [Streptomyces endophyticus]